MYSILIHNYWDVNYLWYLVFYKNTHHWSFRGVDNYLLPIESEPNLPWGRNIFKVCSALTKNVTIKLIGFQHLKFNPFIKVNRQYFSFFLIIKFCNLSFNIFARKLVRTSYIADVIIIRIYIISQNRRFYPPSRSFY